MAIAEIAKSDNRQLQNVANVLACSKKVVVITGAGISTNCGIPVNHWCTQTENPPRILMLRRTFGLKRAYMP